MENPEANFQEVRIETEKNLPHGIREAVPSRIGISATEGQEVQSFPNVLQDPETDIRRAHYGEEDKFFGSNIHGEVSIEHVNDIKTPNNPTKADRIIPGTEFSGDGFYNHSCSG
jgi:hypothetical protein